MCISWNNKKVFDTIDARCYHEDQNTTIASFTGVRKPNINLLKPNDIYIYIYIYMSYRSANLQTLHFKYLFNKYTY